MDNAKEGEKSEKESPPLRIDPKWCARLAIIDIVPIAHHRGIPSLQEALRTFLEPIKNEDPRLDFYTMYKKEATEYDTDLVRKYDEDLSTTLIFVRSSSCAHVNKLTKFRRPVCSLPSARLSLSTFTTSFNPIPTTNLPDILLPVTSSLPLLSCTQVF